MTALAQALNLQITQQNPHLGGVQSYLVPEVGIMIEHTAEVWTVNQAQQSTEFADAKAMTVFIADRVVRSRFHLQDEPTYFAFEE